MPPKKREKDADTSKNPRMDQMQADHELFLQAFEKPTQIYRFLRTRNMISPIFLNRTLAYMKGRMSRTNMTRQTFRVDSLLDRALTKQREASRPDRPLSSYMTLTFIGYYDKKECSLDTVLVETFLVKICHKKRKDVSSPIMQVCVGTSEVTINPSEDIDPSKGPMPQAPTVSIPTESFSLSNGHLVKSYMLLLRVHYASSKNSFISDATNSSHNDQDSAGEPPPKRRRSSSIPVSQQGMQRSTENDNGNGETRLYGAELVVYDRHNRCLLTDGDYELALQVSQTYTPPQGQQNEGVSLRGSNCFNHANGQGPPLRASPRKHSSWETVGEHIAEDLGPFEAFSRGPTLKFRLKWTPEASNSLVERPRPLRPRPGSEQGVHTSQTQQSQQQSSSVPTSTPNSTPSTDGDKENSRPDSAGGIGCRVGRRKTSSLGNENASQQQQDGTVALPPASGLIVHQNGVNHPHNHQLSQQPKLQIVYQFIYNSSSRQQTEACEDLHCPWCSLDCVSLYALLKHLKLCHSRFLFTYVPIAEGARIDVSINEHHDGSYSGGPHDLLSQPPGLAFSRDGPVRRTSVTHVLVCRPPRNRLSLQGTPHQMGASSGNHPHLNSMLPLGPVVNGAYSSQGYGGGAGSIHQRNGSALLPMPVANHHGGQGSASNQNHQTNSQQAVAPYAAPQGGNGPYSQGCLQDAAVGWCGPGSRPSLAEFLQPEALAEEEFHNHRSYITGHNRLYHHTVTCLPIFPKELDIDSEGENDPKWLRTKTVMMIDEFTDVNEGEKELMKMWNLHVMKNGYVGDCQIPLACTMFIDAHGKELLMKNLYRNFVLHLSSLFDFGLLSPVTVYTTLQKLQDIIAGSPDIRKVLHESWHEQRKQWKKTGKAQAAAAAAAAMASQVNIKNNPHGASPAPQSAGADDESMTSREPSPVPVAGRTRGGGGGTGSAPQTPASGHHASRGHASVSSQNSGTSFVRTRGGSLGSNNTNGANFTRSRSSGPSWSSGAPGSIQANAAKAARGTPPPPRKSGVGLRGALDDGDSSDKGAGKDEGSERGS